MTLKQMAPYGTWESPISAATMTSKFRSLTCPRVNARTGRAFFCESRPDGTMTIAEAVSGVIKDVLPAKYSARSGLYGYGGGAFDVLPDDRIIFAARGAGGPGVYLLDPTSQTVTPLLQEDKVHEYGSFFASISLPWVLAIEEDSTDPSPLGVQNYIAAINVETGKVHRVVEGADFYFQPRFSLDGTRVSWTQYNHPELPYTDAKLHVADWDAGAAAVKNVRLVAGDKGESIAEPRWGPDGSLFFCKENGEGSYRQLYRILPGSEQHEHIKLEGLESAEFGYAGHSEPINMYAPLSSDVLLATPIINGTSSVIRIDIPSRTWTQVVDNDAISQVLGNSVCRVNSTSALVIGQGAAASTALHLIDAANPSNSRVLRTSSDDAVSSDYISRPETVHIHSKGSPSRPIYGFLWMPRNPKFSAPEDSLPPLIIRTHGGPTSHTGGVVMMSIQYYTSRGYAFLEVNYTGSTGHGRDYRQRLFGNWGIVDRDDVMEMAEHFVAKGRVGKVGITGASAGGYATLQTLTAYSDRFAGGVCAAGVSDISGLDRLTHKIESDYAPALVLKDPKNTTEEEKERVYRERSALYHSDSITSPLLLIHGEEDTVVPVDQARSIARAMEKNHAEVKLITVPGEGHMFRTPEAEALQVNETEKWWQKTLL